MSKSISFLFILVLLVAVAYAGAQDPNTSHIPTFIERHVAGGNGIPFDDDDEKVLEIYKRYQRKEKELYNKNADERVRDSSKLTPFYVEYILYLEEHGEEIVAAMAEE